MKVEAKLYRLKSNNPEIQDVLDYNFFDYEDNSSKYPLYWRKIVGLSRDQYTTLYETYLNKYLLLFKDTKSFYLDPPMDITKFIDSYGITIELNNLDYTQTIEFNEAFTAEIKENDLIVIKEDDKIAFMGFVVYKTTTMRYGEFRVQSATVANIGYLYNITNIAVNWSAAKYAVGGMDVKKIDIQVMQDVFNNKDVFSIIDYIYKQYFFAKRLPQEGNSKEKINFYEYYFDLETFNKLDNFNTIFPFLKILQLYYELYENKEFKWAEIYHGGHKVYNLQIANGVELYVPSFKTISEIYGDIIKYAMYNYYIEPNGCLVIEPPLYNYFDLDNLVMVDNNRYEFNKDSDFYIKESDIFSFSFVINNAALKTRTDSQFMWSYVGKIDWVPTFYMDLKATLKFGFRNDQPISNPNANNARLATTFSAIMNIIQNSITRSITITVPFASIYKYKIGRLYYIEKFNLMGYLTSISRTISYGSYPVYELQFSYLRTVVYVKPSDDIIIDLISIYKKYGIFSNINGREMSVKQFEKEKQAVIAEFKEKLKDIESIPSFKVFPSILDLIQLIYEESGSNQSQNTKQSLNKQTIEADKSLLFENGRYQYRSFKVKMQRFWDYNAVSDTNGDTKVEFTTNRPIFEGTGKPKEDFKLPNSEDMYFLYNKSLPSVLHKGYNFVLFKGKQNLTIYKMKTQFNKNESLDKVNQLFFNRMYECDAVLKSQCPIYLSDYSVVAPVKLPLNTIKNYAYKIGGVNPYFSISSKSITANNKWRYRKDLNAFNLDKNGDYIINPQTIYNFEFLINNVMKGTETNLSTSNVYSRLFEAHKQGRALDIIIPKGNTEWVLYPDENFLVVENKKIINTVFYKQAFIDYLISVFKVYFDKVEVIPNKIKVFSDNFMIDEVEVDVNIVHLEVFGDNYTNIKTELLNP